MKKTLVIFGAVAAVLLMMSTATAVPTTYGKATIDYLDYLETIKTWLEEKISEIEAKLEGESPKKLDLEGLLRILLLILQAILLLIEILIKLKELQDDEEEPTF